MTLGAQRSACVSWRGSALRRETPAPEGTDRDVVQETYEALMRLGHSAADAHKLVESVSTAKKKFKSTDEMLVEIYQRGK